MIRASWLKRMMARALSRRSKGISTVIATIFLVLVAFLITTQTFLWTMTQNTLYNQAVKEGSQIDADRFSERIATSRAEYTVLPQSGTIQVNMVVSNEGPVSAQIITAWVVWVVEGKTKYAFNDTLNISLNPGEALPVTITVNYTGSTGAFSGWLVTARGNLVSLEKEKLVVHAQVAEGIGSMMMDFETFKYYEVVEDKFLKDYPQGNIAFEVPAGKDIVFAAFLSNYDMKRRTITLSSHSVLWAYFPKAPGQTATWDIAKVTDGTIMPYSPITLAYGESTWIFFGPGRIGSPLQYQSGAINLILLGTIGSQEYGQNLPFVSIYVTG